MPEQVRAEVVVAVGTDHHPFDRLVGWIDDWAKAKPETSVVIQRGTSQEPSHCPSRELFGHDELRERFARATVVVSHGGPSTVMDARMVGRLPIVVARNPELGEHVDDHQLRFADHLGRHGMARLAEDPATLTDLIDEALEFPERFVVAVEDASAGGVTEVANALDHLLGIETMLVPGSAAEAVAAVGPGDAVEPLEPESVESVDSAVMGTESVR